MILDILTAVTVTFAEPLTPPHTILEGFVTPTSKSARPCLFHAPKPFGVSEKLQFSARQKSRP
jgi:hypothetical protein